MYSIIGNPVPIIHKIYYCLVQFGDNPMKYNFWKYLPQILVACISVFKIKRAFLCKCKIYVLNSKIFLQNTSFLEKVIDEITFILFLQV